MTPEERRTAQSVGGKIGAHTRWAGVTDRAAELEDARAGFLAKLEAQVDPDGRMTPAQRAEGAERLRKAHMARMTLLSVQARARRREQQAAEHAATQAQQSLETQPK